MASTLLCFEYKVTTAGSCLECFVFSCRDYFGNLGCGSELETVGHFGEHIIHNYSLSYSVFAESLCKYPFVAVIKNTLTKEA